MDQERSPTVDDVAALAGVSVATVSRALRGLPNVAEPTRSRVLAAATELRYRAHPHASRLATGRTMAVGVVVPRVGQWYYAQVLAGAEAVLARAGYDVLVCGAATLDDRRRLTSVDSPLRQRVDGLLLVGLHLHADEVRRWAGSRLRIVSIGQEITGCPSVGIDDAEAAALAVRHLLNLGHRHIGFIGGRVEEQGPTAPAERRRGYLAELRRHRVRARRDLQVEASPTVAGGKEAMDRLLSTSPPPTAVFAISDELAVGAIDSIRRHGFEVPRHVSVVGFDDHDLAAALDLTTVRQSAARHGSLAAELLLADLRGELGGDRQRREATQLVVRGTTRPLRDG